MSPDLVEVRLSRSSRARMRSLVAILAVVFGIGIASRTAGRYFNLSPGEVAGTLTFVAILAILAATIVKLSRERGRRRQHDPFANAGVDVGVPDGARSYSFDHHQSDATDSVSGDCGDAGGD